VSFQFKLATVKDLPTSLIARGSQKTERERERQCARRRVKEAAAKKAGYLFRCFCFVLAKGDIAARMVGHMSRDYSEQHIKVL